MNYENEYNFYYNKYYSKFENKIKLYFIQQYSKNRSFGITLHEIRTYINDDLGRKNPINSNKDLKQFLNLFSSRHSLYTKDEIKGIFENEIKTSFDKLDKGSLPINYNLQKLISNIALIKAKEEINRLLHIHNMLFELIYELNEFDKFEIKEYTPIALESTDLFKYLNKKKYLNENNQEFFNYIENDDNEISSDLNLKKPTLPLAITMLYEIGFFELEKIKKFSDQQLSKLISIIQIKDPNDKNSLRSISGNVRIAKGGNDNAEKYTARSYKNTSLASKLLKEIKEGE